MVIYHSYNVTIYCVVWNWKFQLTLQHRGKLYLPPRCNRYSTYSTLYALSTLVHNNSRAGILPAAPVDINCCLTTDEKEQLHEIPLHNPLTNMLSSFKDLKIASVKIDEIQEKHAVNILKYHYLGNYCN